MRKRNIPPDFLSLGGGKGECEVGFDIPLVFFRGNKIAREDPLEIIIINTRAIVMHVSRRVFVKHCTIRGHLAWNEDWDD